MDNAPGTEVSTSHRILRCSPFAAAAICFLLPFFSVSSCGANSAVASSTGVEIVVGAEPDVEAPDGGQVAPGDPIVAEARSISQAARPWAVLAAILVAAGIVLMVRMARHHRIAALLIAACAVGALFQVAGAVDIPSSDGTPGDGLLLAIVVLATAALWQVCALAFLAVRAALRPTMNPEWEAQRAEAASCAESPERA
jgi:hypothetical protein